MMKPLSEDYKYAVKKVKKHTLFSLFMCPKRSDDVQSERWGLLDSMWGRCYNSWNRVLLFPKASDGVPLGKDRSPSWLKPFLGFDLTVGMVLSMVQGPEETYREETRCKHARSS